MKISFYFDEMVSPIAAKVLREEGYEVIAATEIGMVEKDDMDDHLPYATERGLVLVTFDRKFAGLAHQIATHSGVICWTGASTDLGGIARKLSQFAAEHEPEDIKGQVFWLK